MNFREWLESYGGTFRGGTYTKGAELFFILGMIIMLGFFFFKWYSKKRRINQVNFVLSILHKRDTSWSKDYLIEYGLSNYYEFIESWCDQDLERIKAITDQSFYKKCESKIMDLKSRGYRDEVKYVTIKTKKIVDIYYDQDEKEFTISLKGSALYQTVNTYGNVVKRKPNNFEYFITCRKKHENWLLSDLSEKYKTSKYRKITKLI